MAQTYWVTPTLLVGRVPEKISRAVRVRTVADAVTMIHAGKTAVLPEDAWDMVRQVLRQLGMGPEAIDDRITFAREGKITAA